MVVADLFSESAVRAVMGEVLHGGLETLNKYPKFRPTGQAEGMKEMLNSLAAMVAELKGYNKLLDCPMEEIQRLESYIQAGEELVRKYPKSSLSRVFTFPYCRDKNLQRHLSLILVAESNSYLLKVTSALRKILEVLPIREDFGPFQGNGLMAPDEPDCMGMDEPLNKLKIELLKDGMSVLVLTGLAGSGKTTLAKKLCWYPQIKGKFGGNIFFVTFSKTPNLKTIAQTLFENCGCKVPEFESDEDATNRLRVLLWLLGRKRNPILLVLDDVMPSSEDLVEKFIFQMKDYKILVTSRIAFRRFGTPFQLNPLNHDQAVSLFRHYAKLNDTSSYIPDENLVHEIVRCCKGLPLELKVTAGSLYQKPFEVWENMRFEKKIDSTKFRYAGG